MKDKKIPFFKRLKLGIFNIEKYQEFASEKMKVTVKYFLKLILLFVMVISLPLTYKFKVMFDDTINIFKNDVPNFSFEDNKLKFDIDEIKVIEREDNQLSRIIVLDTISETQEDIDKSIEKLNLYENGVLFLKDKVILKTAVTNGNVEYTYRSLSETYNFGNANKQDLEQKINSINMSALNIGFYITVVIYLYIVYAIAILMDTVLLSVLGFLVSRISNIKLKYSETFSMAVYSLTLPILLNTIYICINTLTGFTIKYFQIMYTAISYIYMITAILMIKSDLTKQKIEVQKITYEQNKLKEDDENNENPLEDKKDKDKDKEEKDEDKEQKNNKEDEGMEGAEA